MIHGLIEEFVYDDEVIPNRLLVERCEVVLEERRELVQVGQQQCDVGVFARHAAQVQVAVLNVNERLAPRAGAPHVLDTQHLPASVDVKDRFLHIVLDLVQIRREAVDGRRQGDVAAVIARDERLAGQVGDEDRRRHHAVHHVLASSWYVRVRVLFLIV